MLTNEEIIAKVRTIKEMEQMIKDAQKVVDDAKDEIKLHMAETNESEIAVDVFTIRLKAITSNRFDTTKFKKEHLDMYNEYLVESISPRFTIN